MPTGAAFDARSIKLAAVAGVNFRSVSLASPSQFADGSGVCVFGDHSWKDAADGGSGIGHGVLLDLMAHCAPVVTGCQERQACEARPEAKPFFLAWPTPPPRPE